MEITRNKVKDITLGYLVLKLLFIINGIFLTQGSRHNFTGFYKIMWIAVFSEMLQC